MSAHKRLHDFASWRDEWTAADVEKVLAYAGIEGWTFDHWSDGDMQFMHKGPVPFDDLAKLRISFTPLCMSVEAVVNSELHDAQSLEWERSGSRPLERQAIPMMVLVTMSWNETCGADNDHEECRTCLGNGRIRDGETEELRRCLDCGGTGSAP